jgi:hypothetical protein
VATFASFLRAVCVPLLASPLLAQQPMGTVATHDALVTGGLEVRAERASLISNASITAYDSTAPIDLTRGGQVLVCATSQFHLLRSGTGPSLLFALDRGAFELRSPSQPQDVILTPDLRFTFATQGTLDLSLRVTPNGDTCVDNAGPNAPTLQLADVFSSTTYSLAPGQHVLFEHGSLREVVDRETSSCGCPAPIVPQTIATTPGEPTTPTAAAAEHPFPVAVSQGLAPATLPDNSPPAGEKHTQVAAILAVGGNQPDSLTAPPPTTAAPVSTAPPPSPPGAHDIFHSIGHFFHKLFHPGSSKPNP